MGGRGEPRPFVLSVVRPRSEVAGWFGSGFCFGVVGDVIAFCRDRTVPTSRIQYHVFHRSNPRKRPFYHVQVLSSF